MANRTASSNAMFTILMISIFGLLTTTAAYYHPQRLFGQFDNKVRTDPLQQLMNQVKLSNVENLSEEEGKELEQKIREFTMCVDRLPTPTPKFINDLAHFDASNKAPQPMEVIKEEITYIKDILKSPSFALCLDILPSNSTTIMSLSTYCALLMMVSFCVRIFV